MVIGPVPFGTGADLPKEVAGTSRIYVRPVGLIGGQAADFPGKTGNAMALAGGRFAFTTCEVTVRGANRAGRTIADIDSVRAWANALKGAAGERVAELLERLSAPRPGPIGGGAALPLVMGIVNVTPDSFSDGGDYFRPDAAVAHARALAAAGADIIDIGGESTRPGAVAVDPATERERVVPVIEALKPTLDGAAAPRLSIDTRHAEVMEAALKAGASIVNDVTALTGDPRSLAVAAGADAVVLMHMQGAPATMNVDPAYDDVVLDVYDFLEDRISACVAAGIPRDRLIVDPGIGFGKSTGHNRAILRSLALYHGIGCPLMLGVSRKGLGGATDRDRPPKERLPGSLAAALWALDQGAQILRVHDVAETRQAIKVWDGLTR